MQKLSQRRVLTWVTSGIFCIALVFVVLQMEPWSTPSAPQSDRPIQLDLTEEAPDTGRTSEHFRIVDDSLGADIDASGDVQGIATIETNAMVTEVIDGDTVDVLFDDGSTARIRFLGVDTPETVDPRRPVQCFGKEASALTKSFLANARVRLEEDPLADERDAYGRLLRNVLTEEGVDLNAYLIEEGYAHALLTFPLDPVRKKQLADLEAAAKEAARGLWGEACSD